MENKFKRPNSLKELSQRYLQSEDNFDILFRDFLHEFNASPSETALKEEPYPLDKIKSAYLAAVSEQLAYQNDFSIPEWVYKDEYFLEEPFFAGSTEGLKPLLIMESPVPFRRRGIFVSARALKTA